MEGLKQKLLSSCICIDGVVKNARLGMWIPRFKYLLGHEARQATLGQLLTVCLSAIELKIGGAGRENNQANHPGSFKFFRSRQPSTPCSDHLKHGAVHGASQIVWRSSLPMEVQQEVGTELYTCSVIQICMHYQGPRDLF